MISNIMIPDVANMGVFSKTEGPILGSLYERLGFLGSISSAPVVGNSYTAIGF